MIEERFESYVYQIMQYVKYQENKPYIESILEEMRYTLFREDRNYIKQLEQENKQLKEELEVSQSNEETCRLEMLEITKILCLDEHTLFDDVKLKAKSLNSILTELEEWLKLDIQPGVVTSTSLGSYSLDDKVIKKQVLDKIQELKGKYK